MFLIASFIAFAVSASVLLAWPQVAEQGPPFRTIVRVSEASLCSLDDLVTSLKFTAEIRVVNEEEAPLILLRGVPAVYYWRVSRDAESLNKQEWNHYSYVSAESWGHPRGLGAAPDRRFVILRRGGEHKERVRWALLLTEPVKSTALWAQVIASPADDWEPVIEAKTATAWRSHGRLWTGGLRSQPFQITINSSPIRKCKEQPPRDGLPTTSHEQQRVGQSVLRYPGRGKWTNSASMRPVLPARL
jgi:hypothetical protein